jgi:multiple sugar transport system ATP-binding protein
MKMSEGLQIPTTVWEAAHVATLELNSVHKYYLSGQKIVHAVDDLNLKVADGELLAVLGPSGCGKSSTMRMIAGLEAVTYGTISIDGKAVNNLTPAQRNVALAFESYALYQHMTVEQNIGFCLSSRGIADAERSSRVHEIAATLGIQNLLGTRPGSLSGGQQQLVSLSRAIVRKPNIVLLDEPISHLDTMTRIETSMRIRELHNRMGITMIYVTHNQEEALALADRIAIMEGGRLLQIGTREQIIEEPANMFVATFVGEPPINLIPCELRKNDGGVVARSAKGGFSVLLSKRQADIASRKGSGEVIAGLRPRDLHLAPLSKDYQSLSGTLRYSEFLGENTNFGVEFEENSIVVATVTPTGRLEKGEKRKVFLDAERLLFFDPDSGLRL